MSEPVVRLRNAVVVTNGFPLLSGVDLEIPSQSLTARGKRVSCASSVGCWR